VKATVFFKGVWHDNRHVRFDHCEVCGKKLKEGDIIWKKTKKVKTFHKISSYWCESCYDALFIDV